MGAWETLRQKYGTLLAQSQTISWIWYAKQTYVSTTTVLLNFFNVVPATLDLGNMVVAGSLQGMQAFVVKAIRVYFNTIVTTGATFVGSINDVSQLLNTGILTFTVGQKNYGIWPLHALPAGGGAYGTVTNAVATQQLQLGQNGDSDPRSVYSLEHPLLIEPQINFQAQIQWPAALTLVANLNITVMLDGSLIRPVQ